MLFIILVALSLVLFGGFLLFTALEGPEKRFLRAHRARLDREIARGIFILTHVDWSAFFKHVIRVGLERIAHDIAHGSLVVVRFLERLLTRAVRGLRERRITSTVAKISRQEVPLREKLRALRRTFKRVPKVQSESE